MRYLIDAILIVVLLVIGSALQDYGEKLNQSSPLEERLETFENDIQQEAVIRDVYSQNKPYLKQIEENPAGQLAEKASNLIVDVIDITMNFTSEIIKQAWN